MFTAENLTCRRGDRILFENLGFSLTPGALLLLKGPNGVGKSSLLKILAGLLPAEQGNISWKNQPIQKSSDFKRDLMVIGHKSAVKSDSTVYENVSFWAKLHGTETLIPAALKYFDLTRMQDAPASELSAGDRKSVV